MLGSIRERGIPNASTTRATHAGQDPGPPTGAVTVPVNQTSTFALAEVGAHRGWDCARSGNPTRDALETALASLEGACHGFAFASGLAACDAMLRTCGPGDHVVTATTSTTAPSGSSPRCTRPGGRPSTRSTWGTSRRLPRPGGRLRACCGSRPPRTRWLGFPQNAVGAVPGPWDVFLVLRGVKTLAVRMRAHCDNARGVAALLGAHPAVRAVLYPGLPEHPGHDIAARQMRDFGEMVSFRMADTDTALKVCARFQVFTLAESLGGVESLVEHPGRMTHQSVAGSPLELPGDLARLSVGIEDPNDLVADLTQALC